MNPSGSFTNSCFIPYGAIFGAIAQARGISPDEVRVSIDTQTPVDFELPIGQVTEQVEVTGDGDPAEERVGHARARLPLEPGAEITLEANPGTVEAWLQEHACASL